MKWYKIKKSSSDEKESFLAEMADKYFEKELVHEFKYTNINIYPNSTKTALFIRAENKDTQLAGVEISPKDKRRYEDIFQKNNLDEIETFKKELAGQYLKEQILDKEKSMSINLK